MKKIVILEKDNEEIDRLYWMKKTPYLTPCTYFCQF